MHLRIAVLQGNNCFTKFTFIEKLINSSIYTVGLRATNYFCKILLLSLKIEHVKKRNVAFP